MTRRAQDHRAFLLVILGLVVLTAVVVKVFTQGATIAQQQTRLNEQQAAATQQRAQIVTALKAIQDQRTMTCLDNNSRRRATLRELNKLVATAEGTATLAQRARLEASKASTLLLLNAFLPHRNCSIINSPVRQPPARRPPL